jgi:Histidine kinase-like ATPase domain
MTESQCVDRVVQLVLPPSDRHVRTARLVAADVATTAGLDCDETDDLRIAVDEVCHALLRRGSGPLSFTFTGDPLGGVSMTAAAEDRALASDDVTEFAAAVLGWVADSFAVTAADGELRFFLSKRHVEGAGCRR